MAMTLNSRGMPCSDASGGPAHAGPHREGVSVLLRLLEGRCGRQHTTWLPMPTPKAVTRPRSTTSPGIALAALACLSTTGGGPCAAGISRMPEQVEFDKTRIAGKLKAAGGG